MAQNVHPAYRTPAVFYYHHNTLVYHYRGVTYFYPPDVVGSYPNALVYPTVPGLGDRGVFWNTQGYAAPYLPTESYMTWADYNLNYLKQNIYLGCLDEVENVLTMKPYMSRYYQAHYKYKETPLHLALRAVRNREEMLRLLLNHGLDPNLEDEHGRTALMHTAVVGQRSMVKLLAEWPGTNLQHRNSQGSTALHMACLYGKCDAAHTLLAAGAPPDDLMEGVSRWAGLASLDLAACRGFLDIVKLLMMTGCDPELRTWYRPHQIEHSYPNVFPGVVRKLPMVRLLLMFGSPLRQYLTVARSMFPGNPPPQTLQALLTVPTLQQAALFAERRRLRLWCRAIGLSFTQFMTNHYMKVMCKTVPVPILNCIFFDECVNRQ